MALLRLPFRSRGPEPVPEVTNAGEGSKLPDDVETGSWFGRDYVEVAARTDAVGVISPSTAEHLGVGLIQYGFLVNRVTPTNLSRFFFFRSPRFHENPSVPEGFISLNVRFPVSGIMSYTIPNCNLLRRP